MTNVQDLQQAMREWELAFRAQADYFRDHDVLDPACYDRWLDLRAIQDATQARLDRLVIECRLDGGVADV